MLFALQIATSFPFDLSSRRSLSSNLGEVIANQPDVTCCSCRPFIETLKSWRRVMRVSITRVYRKDDHRSVGFCMSTYEHISQPSYEFHSSRLMKTMISEMRSPRGGKRLADVLMFTERALADVHDEGGRNVAGSNLR